MGLAITEDHRALTDVARSMVSTRGGLATARKLLLDSGDPGRWWTDDSLWKEIVATGWLGLHIDEAFGGEGYTLAELVIVLEQLGRAALGGPFLPTVTASAVIAAAGSDQQRQRWLPRLCSGDIVAGIAAPNAVAISDSRLSGAKVAVLAESSADLFVFPIGGDVVLVEAGDGLMARQVDTVDQLTRAITAVDLDGAAVADVIAGGAHYVADRLRLFAAAEAVGGLAACTELATRYAGEREQFGRLIGSFQAVKHHCANMLLDTELAVATLWDAARAEGRESELAAVLAAAQALPAYQRVALRNIQIHGGIGYTWEHDAHLFLRRATVLLTFVGGQDYLRDQVFALQQGGARRTQSVDLPPEADKYRGLAADFRARLEQTEEGERHKLWARSGYLQPHWPEPFGRGADSIEQLVIEEELEGLERPELGIGGWVIPTLLQRGNPEQIERLLWPSLEGELRWCQLFSEPGAGSDAAAVSTKAVRTDGGWVVTGQKVWSSEATICQRGLATVRTDSDAPKHKGITAVIIDLTDPAVEIRPLVELTGEALFNEVFFNDVFVPDRDVVGEVNAGWSVAMATLGNERVSIAGGSVTLPAVGLLDIMARVGDADPGRARELGGLLSEANALSAMNLRQAERAVVDAGPGIEGNIGKLCGAEHAQRVSELALRIAGPAVLTGDESGVAHDYLFSRCLTIAGGTSEVLRNVIAERIMGLPREPAPLKL